MQQQCGRSVAMAAAALSLFALVTPGLASSALADKQKGFMKARPLDAQTLDRELDAAIGEALGCGGRVDGKKLATIERELDAMWRTLPKNAAGNIDRRSLRYLVHRHFSRKSALHIRGFEPMRVLNASGWGGEDILSLRVPAFVESVLESQHKMEHGFKLKDAAQMVATLEQLIYDVEGSLLEEVYAKLGMRTDTSIGREGMQRTMETYLVYWLLGEDRMGAAQVLRNRAALPEVFPHWDQLATLAQAGASSLEYRRRAAPAAAMADGSAREGHNALGSQFSFEDAHSMAGEITTSFASFWESECSAMKTQLIEMDTHHTGRVPLSQFYGTGLDKDWRFGESEEYLRELGALDETSWRGKQVIIPNYIQAASNCIVAGPHYRVCCVNDCEVLLDEVERKIAAPRASPATILAVVGNLTSHISVDDDEPPSLDASLRSQLMQIAEASGGEVPIQGRLFAQWLHYVFPRECPFPHKSGAATMAAPMEFGSRHVATHEEMLRHADNASDVPDAVDREELEWMSQWSPEEELIIDHHRQSSMRPGAVAGAVLVLAVLILGAFSRRSPAESPIVAGRGASIGYGLLPKSKEQKEHFV